MSRRRRITPDQVRELALSLPEVVESAHFDKPDFRVRNRIFATLPRGGETVVLRMTAADVDALVRADAATFRDEWRGRWLAIRLDRIRLPALRDLVIDAWKTVAPKRLAATLESK